MALTITDYLNGRFDYTFTELNMQSVLEGRAIDGATLATDVSEQYKDLLMADLYMILANVSGGAGQTVKKGDTTVTGRSYNYGITDRTRFRAQANLLYSKWGEDTVEVGGVQFLTMY